MKVTYLNSPQTVKKEESKKDKEPIQVVDLNTPGDEFVSADKQQEVKKACLRETGGETDPQMIPFAILARKALEFVNDEFGDDIERAAGKVKKGLSHVAKELKDDWKYNIKPGVKDMAVTGKTTLNIAGDFIGNGLNAAARKVKKAWKDEQDRPGTSSTSNNDVASTSSKNETEEKESIAQPLSRSSSESSISSVAESIISQGEMVGNDLFYECDDKLNNDGTKSKLSIKCEPVDICDGKVKNVKLKGQNVDFNGIQVSSFELKSEKDQLVSLDFRKNVPELSSPVKMKFFASMTENDLNRTLSHPNYNKLKVANGIVNLNNSEVKFSKDKVHLKSTIQQNDIDILKTSIDIEGNIELKNKKLVFTNGKAMNNNYLMKGILFCKNPEFDYSYLEDKGFNLALNNLSIEDNKITVVGTILMPKGELKFLKRDN